MIPLLLLRLLLRLLLLLLLLLLELPRLERSHVLPAPLPARRSRGVHADRPRWPGVAGGRREGLHSGESLAENDGGNGHSGRRLGPPARASGSCSAPRRLGEASWTGVV